MLGLLRDFEVSVIVKFLSFSERLKVLMLLSRSWLRFIFKNYAWSSFPTQSQVFLVSGFLNFINSFHNLAGIDLPYFPGSLLTPERIALLQTAESVSIHSLRLGIAIAHFKANPNFLGKIKELSLTAVAYPKEQECLD